jgi:lipoprotein-anchoring transpeptidase ErfK/SrfK
VQVFARGMNRDRGEHEHSPEAKNPGACAFHDRATPHAKGFADMRTTRRTFSPLAVALAALFFAGAAAATPQDSGYAYATPDAGPASAYDEAGLADPDGLYLQAGEFAWLPAADARSDGPVTVLVSLGDQRAYVYRDGVRIAVSTVSTGKPGHDTPTGVFPIMGKERMHHSNKYDNAPMPWMQRLTRWGHALHAGNVRPTPASHGCIRLPAQFAKQLYSLTKRGDLVLITQDVSMQSMERAGVDSQLAQMVGATSRLQPVADRVALDGQAGNPAIPAGVPTGTSF